jgi:hypothetical protein
MQGIYIYIPETNDVPKECNVRAILSLIIKTSHVPVSLEAQLHRLFYPLFYPTYNKPSPSCRLFALCSATYLTLFLSTTRYLTQYIPILNCCYNDPLAHPLTLCTFNLFPDRSPSTSAFVTSCTCKLIS